MIKVGIIGAGTIAREHAEAIAAAGRLKLVAAADTAADRLAGFCEAFHVDSRHADPMALIASPDIDLVVVATPPSSHEALVTAALDAGKHVLCEKPLAHSLASARRILEAEARHPGRLSVGHQLRYYEPFQRIESLVRQGTLGELRFAALQRHGTIVGADQGGPGWWGAWEIAGGGVLLTQMVHELDLLIQLMGAPRSVRAVADTRFSAIPSEDFVDATITFDGGRTAWCAGTVNSGVRAGGFSVRGDKGEASLFGRVRLFDDGRSWPTSAKAAPNAHVAFHLDIADAIERGGPMPIPPADAFRALELAMAIYESALTGEEVRLPLGEASRVYDGVRPQDYQARRCDRALPAVFLPAEPAAGGPEGLGRLKSASRRLLTGLGLDPALVKAMVRPPPPVNGGPKTRVRSWPRRQTFGRAEKRAVMRLMDREIRRGDAIHYDGAEESAYCRAFADYLGGGYADAVNSGTNAVYVALRALDLEPGSEVVVAPVTDAGGTMPVAVMNCIPVLADSAPGSVLASAEQIRDVLSARTSAIVVAHIAGHPVDLDPILALAAERGLPVVEDCAQAHGTLYKGRMVGTFGDIAAFSTMYLKNHATGGQGGVVFTRNPRLFVRARQAADRGKPFGAAGAAGNVLASLNFNQDELSMAIGRVQLEKLPAQVAARRAIAAAVEAGLQGVDEVSLVGDPPYGQSSYHFLMFRLDVERLGCTAEEFAEDLCADGIAPAATYHAFPTDSPWYRDRAVFGTSGMPWSLRTEAPTPEDFPLTNAREATRRLLRIGLHDGVGEREARDIVKAIRKAVRWRLGGAAAAP